MALLQLWEDSFVEGRCPNCDDHVHSARSVRSDERGNVEYQPKDGTGSGRRTVRHPDEDDNWPRARPVTARDKRRRPDACWPGRM
jgi:hypothetical protein